MKKKNYFQFVYKKLILWLIISALLTVGFGELSYKEYDYYVNGLKDGNDADNLTCYLTARYLSCALRNDPRINQYKSRMKVIPDYEYFAKVKDDGSLEVIYQTNYDDIYCEMDGDGWRWDRSFEYQLDTIKDTLHYEYINDEGDTWYTEEPKLRKEDQIAELKEQTGKDYVPLYWYLEYYITSDYDKTIPVYNNEYYDVRFSGDQTERTGFKKSYVCCLSRTVLGNYMDRSHDLKKLQNTHRLIADKIRSLFPWLNENGSDADSLLPLGSLLSKYDGLYDDDLVMDDMVNPKSFTLNNEKYQIGTSSNESGTTFTIPSVYKKPEKLLSRYKKILEPQNVDISKAKFDSLFMSDDRETNLLMNYGFGAQYSNNYFFNYGHLVQNGIIQTKEGCYYYAFATPLAGFWETENSVILVFFAIIFATGFVLVNLLSIWPYILYVNKYNNTVFKAGLIDTLAHNLKTPMQIISVNAENIKDTDSPEEKDGHADIILSLTESVNAMVEKILKAADRKAVKTVFEIREVMEQMAEKTGANIEINGTGKIKADREFFEQAVYNLIDNANKYRSEGDILVNVKGGRIEIVNACESQDFTPGAGIAIADRFLIQNGMKLKLKVKDGKFTAIIIF